MRPAVGVAGRSRPPRSAHRDRDDPNAAAGRHALELSDARARAGREFRDGAAHLGCPRTATASDPQLQASRDKRFLEKLTDVVGLYLHPPDKAIVLCVDEESQIQALDRTQPGLPLKKGPMWHDDP